MLRRLQLADHLEPDQRAKPHRLRPTNSITGTSGLGEFLEEGRILQAKGTKLVDNAWAAPGASGCGGFLVELILDPIINAAAGVPAVCGHEHRDPQQRNLRRLRRGGAQKQRGKPLGPSPRKRSGKAPGREPRRFALIALKGF